MPSETRDAPIPESEATPRKAWTAPRVIVSEAVAQGVAKTDSSVLERHYTTSFNDS